MDSLLGDRQRAGDLLLLLVLAVVELDDLALGVLAGRADAVVLRGAATVA